MLMRKTLCLLTIVLIVSSLDAAGLANKSRILQRSEISYQAEGGFTGVNAYSVHISCVDGKISTLAMIKDPRLTHDATSTLKKTGTLTKEEYLNLWARLDRMAIFDKKDAPSPKLEIFDEFTLNFVAKVGPIENQFSVQGCSRPEASQYHAFRQLLDQSVNMASLWDSHQSIARK